MTLNDVQRVMLLEFALREVGDEGNLDSVKGVCYVIRNRVRAGWSDGNWMRVIESAQETAAHLPNKFTLDPDSRLLQRMIQEVDDIYYSMEWSGRTDSTKDQQGDSIESSVGTSLYWMWMKRKAHPWFIEQIVQDHKNHPVRTQIGLMMFFK